VELEQNTLRMLTIPEVNDVIIGELAEPGEWVVANVETSSFWPVKAQKCGIEVRQSGSCQS
jgi:hypothetical protein